MGCLPGGGLCVEFLGSGPSVTYADIRIGSFEGTGCGGTVVDVGLGIDDKSVGVAASNHSTPDAQPD